MTNVKAHLHLVDDDADNGRRTAVLEIPGQDRKSVTYERPDGPLVGDGNANPFVLAVFLTMMEARRPLHVHGSVSASLLGNLEELQYVWRKWRPDRYGLFDIEVDGLVGAPEHKPNSATGRSIAAFSGGVDASFVVQRHLYGPLQHSRTDLRAALMIQGLDIALSETDGFERAKARARETLSGTNVELLSIATDFKGLYQNWPDAFGLAIASCLLQFERDYSVGLIGSSEDYASLALPYGSSPVTDHFYSTDAMSIRHDGASHSRLEKIAALRESPELVENLRVCWTGAQRDRNCGTCTKCIMTMLYFRLITDVPAPCFPTQVNSELMRSLRVWNQTQLSELSGILDEATKLGLQDHWVAALQEAIARNRGRLATSDDPLWRRRAPVTA